MHIFLMRRPSWPNLFPLFSGVAGSAVVTCLQSVLTSVLCLSADRLLLMLRALKRAHALEPSNDRLAGQLVRFRRLLAEREGQLSEAVRAVVAEAAPRLFGDHTAQQLADRVVSEHPDSLAHVLQGELTGGGMNKWEQR